MSQEIDQFRRRFLGSAAMTRPAGHLGLIDVAHAQSATPTEVKGYRVIVPYVRGYGATRFLSPSTTRNGQPSVIALDVIALMDALNIDKAIVAACDWGARTAAIMAALWPERCKALVSVSGYLIGSREDNKKTLPPQAELQWWYQFYFATKRGRIGYEAYRHEFARMIWEIASPKWQFDDATFDRSAASFDNPDHVSIVIRNYRWRLGLAEGESAYDALENRLASGPFITVPHYARRGRQRCAASGPNRLCREVLGQVRAPEPDRRYRPQLAARSPSGVRLGYRRRGCPLTAGVSIWSALS
jgi:pimeloyl-ACP methyl ester carboxylesterase